MRWFFLIIVCSACFSCKGFDAYFRHDHLNSLTEKEFSNTEIHVKNYFLCCYSRRRSLWENNFEDKAINGDSILINVLNKIESQGVNLEYDTLFNVSENKICHRETLRLKHFLNQNHLNNLQIDSKGKKVLVPVVNIADLYTFTGYMTSNMVAGDGGFMNFTSLSLMIFIIEDNKVIFAEHRRYASKRTFANSLEEVRAIPPAYQVREEHIEELVRRAMKKYVKRLER